MEYSNPKLPEGINTTEEHPLKEFAVLSGGVLLVVVMGVTALGFSADLLARRIPFSFEQAMVASYPGSVPEPHPVDAVLQPLAGRIAEAMDLPEDMAITIHYQDSELVNAAATFGGHIILYRGLVSRLPNVNTLTMVMAHEIAHIKHRHPIRSVGRGAVVWLSLMALVGADGGDVAFGAVTDVGTLTLLTFDRAQEQEADREALAAVNALYGHTAGALDLYEVLLEHSSESVEDLPAFLSTHPLTLDRIRKLKAMQTDLGWSSTGTTQALPIGLRQP